MLQILKPKHLEPVLRNKGSHHGEKPMQLKEEWSPVATTGKKPTHSKEDPTQPKIKNQIIFKIKKRMEDQ